MVTRIWTGPVDWKNLEKLRQMSPMPMWMILREVSTAMCLDLADHDVVPSRAARVRMMADGWLTGCCSL